MIELDGEKIKKIRQDKGLTQEDVAIAMKLYAKTYARKEKDGTFDEKERERLLEILRIPLDMVIKERPLNGNNHQEVDYQQKYISNLERERDDLREQVRELRSRLDSLSEVKKIISDLNSKLEENLDDLHESVKLNQAEVLTVADCLKTHRKKMEKGETIEKLDAEASKFLSLNVQKILKT